MSALETKVALVLDTRGLLCPGPVMKASSAIKRIRIGEVLEVLATDPGSKPDLRNWAKLTGNELLVSTEEHGSPTVYRTLVRRLK